MQKNQQCRHIQMRLICLTPFRNAAGHLAGYFRSVNAFCDGIVALDDGSTDDTVALLASNPRVLTVLRNPVRRGYAGWDDAQNRARLLAAAGQFTPDWIVQLDADERMDEQSGRRLRKFLETEACPDFAYGFYLCRMIGDEQHFDKSMEIFRVFAFRDGLRLPKRKLHLIPVPESIKREHWFSLKIRIKHLAGVTPALRRRRVKKYEEADPHNQWQASYTNLLSEPGQVKKWHQPQGGSLLVEPGRHAQAVATLKQIQTLLGRTCGAVQPQGTHRSQKTPSDRS